jgi:hypothetical protein
VASAIALALARVRLLVADAYRLGRRGEQDAGKEAARQLMADALVDLELALKSVADAGRLETGQRYANDKAATLRAALLDLPRDASPELAAGVWGGVAGGRGARLANRAFTKSVRLQVTGPTAAPRRDPYV